MKQRYYGLRREFWSMPDGKRKLVVLEEAIRIADQYMTESDAYDARMDYSSATLECGCPERLFISFSWCLAKFENNPGVYSSFSIMWHYKWVLNQIWRLPQFSLEQIEAVFADFERKCKQYGYTLRAYYQQKVNFLLSQGHLEAAAAYHKLWKETPRDSLSDCLACEQNLFGEYYFRINHLKRGMQTIKPILDGRMSCRSVPQTTYSNMIVPLLKLGEFDRAIDIAKKAFRSIEGPSYLPEYGVFMEFFTVTDMPKAVKLYERTIQLGLESKMPWDRFQYLLSVRLFLQQWSKVKRRKKLAESEQVTLAWLDEEIGTLAQAFNDRNGNDYMHRFIAEKEQNISRLVKKISGG
ncbi:hypothetical protein [Paenibacillus radicis (ex Gao et al. 2016)]|uniref:Tetratricopeptide repeat protein n=1 Tax=Paenibacillus radicis (ex Gao et al. 2016) TaxID=1737354 RepID=A0A917LZ52_9BACL|nr:hypothetical protein [Paenibacillus radicis (ex Gao et al. 2016)]GGG66805.1 hypothetical protein GCM10010918_21630 [Paenibacillus radicis (ex Gao et al. 2016)]